MPRGKANTNAHTRPQETIAAVPTNRSPYMVQMFFDTDMGATRGEETQLVIGYIDDDGFTEHEEFTTEADILQARTDLQTNFGIRIDFP
jgi:hypothetical protein